MLFKKEEKPVSCYLQVRVKESEKEALKEIEELSWKFWSLVVPVI